MDDLSGIKPPGLQISEHVDPDRARRLTLIGEPDYSTAHHLGDHLRLLRHRSAHVRLDLSKLIFIDSSGIRELTQAALDARHHGPLLETASQLTDPVRHVLAAAGVDTRFWPPHTPPPSRRLRHPLDGMVVRV